jgi:L-iditol 2-dehydrogenase
MSDPVGMGRDMLAVRVHGPGDLRVERVRRPEPSAGEALLRVLAAGVCATDRKLVDRGPPGSEPRVLGHEIVAEVVTAPPDGPAVGSRVAIAPNLGCENCPACDEGATNLCPDYRAFGIHLDGGMAEYLLAPRRALEGGHLLPIPAGLPTLEAVTLEPLACCVEGLEACALRLGESVLIVGAGVMGRLHVSAARALGAGTVIVSDPDRGRLEHARSLGADVAISADEPLREAVAAATGGLGVDVAAVTIGAAPAAEAALASLARGGRLNLFAGFGAAAALTLDANDVHYRRLQIVGTSGATSTTLRRTLRALASRRIALGGIVSSVRPLEEAAAAFVEARDRGHARVVLTPDRGSGR